MNAVEAKKLALQVQPNAIARLHSEVISDIREAAGHGHMEISCMLLKRASEAVRNAVLDRLREEGYKVSNYGDNTHRIYWSE
jgi:hypothetical protein